MNDVSTTQMAYREKNGVNVLMSTHKAKMAITSPKRLKAFMRKP